MAHLFRMGADVPQPDPADQVRPICAATKRSVEKTARTRRHRLRGRPAKARSPWLDEPEPSRATATAAQNLDTHRDLDAAQDAADHLDTAGSMRPRRLRLNLAVDLEVAGQTACPCTLAASALPAYEQKFYRSLNDGP